jgi:3-oxoacyl-[acyl-carrier-protein] synthase-1/3-oxoacyl-[acyl-carrier-protein] synthase II
VRSIAIVATGAVSPLGVGGASFDLGDIGEPARTAIARDQSFATDGLQRPNAARVSTDLSAVNACRAQALLTLALRDLITNLDRNLPAWRSRRIGVVLGTSGGGMGRLCEALAKRAEGQLVSPELAQDATYFGPLAALSELGVEPVESAQLLVACVSSVMAVGLGCRWLQAGRVELAITGGYDAASLFIAAGFEALGATTAAVPAPFRVQRDGMALGEAAALLALTNSSAKLSGKAFGYVRGFAATSDAIHVTAPDREGKSLAEAARLALQQAGLAPHDIDLISAHATSTPFNDAAETKVLNTVLGEHARSVHVQPFKAVVGHTLGAAGALETLAALEAIKRQILPAAVGSGALQPDFVATLAERNQAGSVRACLKLSSAFGGANAALVVSATPSADNSEFVEPTVLVTVQGDTKTCLVAGELSGIAKLSELAVQRLDSLSELVIAAAASVVRKLGRPLPERTGIVVGSASATLEINELFAARLRTRGPGGVEPRRFPATSPNLCAAQCSIAFGLHGPALTVAASPHAALEALLVGYDLLAAGDADALLVIAAEDAGPVVRDLWTAAGFPVPDREARALLLETAGEGQRLDRAKVHARLQAARLSAQEPGQVPAPGWPSLFAGLEKP